MTLIVGSDKRTIQFGKRLLDKGRYECVLANVEERVNPNGPFRVWKWNAIDPNGQVHQLTSCSSMCSGPTSKTREVAEALLGRPVRDGEEIEFGEFIGRPAMLTVSVVERNGRTYNNVEKVEAVTKATEKAPKEL